MKYQEKLNGGVRLWAVDPSDQNVVPIIVKHDAVVALEACLATKRSKVLPTEMNSIYFAIANYIFDNFAKEAELPIIINRYCVRALSVMLSEGNNLQ